MRLLALLVLLPLTLGWIEPPEESAGRTGISMEDALRATLDDERRAMHFYEAVMERHGVRRPFANIVHAERRHQDALLRQFERLGLDVPEDAWEDHEFDVPETFRACCDASIVAEVRNARLYDEHLAAVTDDEVRAVFDALRRASIKRHLVAFRRHGSGWAPLDPESMTESQTTQRDKAVQAQSALVASLMSELSKALVEGGAEGAIDVCATRARQIATEVGEANEVKIGRTSWKLRNPRNQPPVWAALLTDDRVESPTLVANDHGEFGMLSPIRLASTCLRCHGSGADLDPGAVEALRTTYPEDRATGFREGDLRGWIWVEVAP